jgi:hypothetical protein
MFNLGESKLNLRLGQRFDSVNFVISNCFLLINKVRFVSGNESGLNIAFFAVSVSRLNELPNSFENIC